MKTVFAALVAAVAFSGVAAAEGSPQLIGNYSANVLEEYNGNSNGAVAQSNGMDFTSTAAIRSEGATTRGYGWKPDRGNGPSVSGFDIHSGR